KATAARLDTSDCHTGGTGRRAHSSCTTGRTLCATQRRRVCAVLSHTVRCIGGLSSRQLGADTAGHTTTHRPLQYLPADCWHLYAVSRAATGTRNTYPAVRNHLARCFVGYCFTAVLDLGTTVGLCSDLCGPWLGRVMVPARHLSCWRRRSRMACGSGRPPVCRWRHHLCSPTTERVPLHVWIPRDISCLYGPGMGTTFCRYSCFLVTERTLRCRTGRCISIDDSTRVRYAVDH